jgi:hypothetical protein
MATSAPIKSRFKKSVSTAPLRTGHLPGFRRAGSCHHSARIHDNLQEPAVFESPDSWKLGDPLIAVGVP